ncbi:MAG TPA: hypothetical protein DDZ88_15680 [Verrucomicrobiales bacterium]|nr:hypothetical protein [Verrucomicrobiales bacterium]
MRIIGWRWRAVGKINHEFCEGFGDLSGVTIGTDGLEKFIDLCCRLGRCVAGAFSDELDHVGGSLGSDFSGRAGIQDRSAHGTHGMPEIGTGFREFLVFRRSNPAPVSASRVAGENEPHT